MKYQTLKTFLISFCKCLPFLFLVYLLLNLFFFKHWCSVSRFRKRSLLNYGLTNTIKLYIWKSGMLLIPCWIILTKIPSKYLPGFYKLYTKPPNALKRKLFVPFQATSDVVKGFKRVPINLLTTPHNLKRAHNVGEWIPQVEEMHWLLLSGGAAAQTATSCLDSR